MPVHASDRLQYSVDIIDIKWIGNDIAIYTTRDLRNGTGGDSILFALIRHRVASNCSSMIISLSNSYHFGQIIVDNSGFDVCSERKLGI